MSDQPLIHDPGNDAEIDGLYVFMPIDSQGRNGILGRATALGIMPMVTASPTLAKEMQAFAETIAKNTGKRVGMFKFTRVAQLWGSG